MSNTAITEPHSKQNFPVVGVGASAGGVNAFKRFLRNIPENSGMAFVLVQHLSPEHESLLPELLAPETALPVHVITDDLNIAPNHVYIIPENKMLITRNGKLVLEQRDPTLRNKIIDRFFTSLAEVHDSFARGVILTGPGYDGTEGLLTIKEKGGTTFVQNPEDADFDSMPQSAIRSGAADFVLDIEDIPAQLHNINQAHEANHAHEGEKGIEQMRDDMRRVTEDQEAANEELETSAGELQSGNEELITVNDELMDRQEQLVMARMYSEAIVETVREPLIVLDRDMRVKSANASFYKFFRTGEHDTEGRLIFDLNSGQWNIKALKESLKGVLTNTAKIEDYEIKVYSPEMGERTMLVNARLIKNENLSEQLILLALEDITAIRAANALLLQSNRELEENNKELSSFSYIASHDLQEPLRKIYTFSKLVLENEEATLSENARLYIDRILVSTNRMQQLIDDLLMYSHISNFKETDFCDCDLNLIVGEVIADLEDKITEKKAKLHVASLPVVKGRDALLHQLFINLMCNSLKYSREGVIPEIKVRAEAVNGREIQLLGGDGNTAYHKISVEDNGIGFRQEQAQTIFEPFKRLHSKDKYEGSGIGLAICNRILIKHRGFLNAESVPGKGTIFNIYLPL